MSYKQSPKPLKQIGDELGVAYVLAGTVNWDRPEQGGGRVRVTPELIQIKGDRQIWSRSFTGTTTSVGVVGATDTSVVLRGYQQRIVVDRAPTPPPSTLLRPTPASIR